jgi:hypothetical protein
MKLSKTPKETSEGYLLTNHMAQPATITPPMNITKQ